MYTLADQFYIHSIHHIWIAVRLEFCYCHFDCLRTAATSSPIVHLPYIIHEYDERRWNDIERWKRKTRSTYCHRTTLSTTNASLIGPGANPGLLHEKPATNRLIHGTTKIKDFLLSCLPKHGDICGQTLKRHVVSSLLRNGNVWRLFFRSQAL
jgi:hypothetical protein